MIAKKEYLLSTDCLQYYDRHLMSQFHARCKGKEGLRAQLTVILGLSEKIKGVRKSPNT